MTYIEQLRERERRIAKKLYLMLALIALYFYVGVQIGMLQ